MYDYQGRSYLHIPQDVGVSLRSSDAPDKCYLPKKQLHVWSGHTKVSGTWQRLLSVLYWCSTLVIVLLTMHTFVNRFFFQYHTVPILPRPHFLIDKNSLIVNVQEVLRNNSVLQNGNACFHHSDLIMHALSKSLNKTEKASR